MKFYKYLLGISIIGSLLLLHSCKDDCPPCDDPTNSECSNYDPNYGKPTADFTIRQSLKPFEWPNKPEEIAEFCDTIVAANSGVLFTAKEENALRYEWTIGEDNRTFTTREVALRFDDYLEDKNNIWRPIPVKLKVVKVPDAPHNPADSIYTTERFLVFADEFLWNGTFEGYFEHEPDKKRVISYDYTKTHTWTLSKEESGIGTPVDVEGVYFLGFPQSDTLRVENLRVLNKSFPNFFSYKQRKWKMDETQKTASLSFMTMSSGITYFHAYAIPSTDGRHKIRLEYKHQTERNGVETTYVFNGTKLN
jgi:hypothetical protein